MSAKQGYLHAQFQLGLCYDLEYGIEVSKENTLELYQMPAEKEYNVAQNNLGSLYIYAAESGYEVGLYNMGEYYELGYGAEKDKRI
ncbi:19674_t:CDS:2 [Funneliformis geosporum]|nr:19674_t:CDS:2 [Funneliformis geosporum]